MVIQMGIS